MNTINFIKKSLRPKLNLIKGTRFVSFLFIGTSILIAAGILWGASVYYNIDTGEVVMEEVERVTGIIRATAGLIVAGTDTQNPATGYVFEVAGGTKLGGTTTVSAGPLELTAANQALRFSGGTGYYTGFMATTTMSTTTIYWLPKQYASSSDYVLTYQSGNQLEWRPATELGLVGDISSVGDVSSGDAFTAGGTGNRLWFHNGAATGTLTMASLTSNATYTLPNISGTNYLTLSAGGLGTGAVLFSNSGLISTSSNFYWDNSSRYLQIGSTANAGQLRIYSSNGSGYYLGFTANSGMTTSTTYTWPVDYGSNNYVLASDGSGGLSWKSATGTGAVTTYGTPVAGQIAFFYNDNTVMGDTGFTWASTTDTLTISGTMIANIYSSNSTTTLQSGAGYPIVLDPDSGKIIINSGDWIETYSGYQIGKAGTEVLREMIPIFGFDLPSQTATTTYVKISRTIENYPFSGAATGSTRVHRLVIRYTDNLALASSTDWRVATTSGAYSPFTLPGSNNAGLDSGQATTTGSVTIPTDGTDWWLEVKSQETYPDNKIKIFQVFLAAYDQIQ